MSNFLYLSALWLWGSQLLNPSNLVHWLSILCILWLAVPYQLYKHKNFSVRPFIKPPYLFVGLLLALGVVVGTYYAPPDVVLKPLDYAWQTTGFLMFCHLFWQHTSFEQQQKLEHYIVLGAALCCVISLPKYVWWPRDYGRLSWIGPSWHQIMGGLLFSQIAFLALWRAKLVQHRQRYIYAACALLMFVCIYLTKSRLAYIGCWCAGLYLARHVLPKTLWRLALGAWLCVTSFVIYSLAFDLSLLDAVFNVVGVDPQVLHRPSYRLGVWRRAIELIPQHLWLGHGVSTMFPYKFIHPHNIWLGLLFYQGVVGFVLFLAFVIYGFAKAGRKLWQPAYVPLVCALIMLGVTSMADFSVVARSAGVLWFNFWWPLMWLHYVARHNTQQA